MKINKLPPKEAAEREVLLRRPVCVIGLAFVVIIVIYMYIAPPQRPSYKELEGSTAIIAGQVDKKEYRTSYEQEILVIYLKNVQILSSRATNSQTANSQTSNSQTASSRTTNSQMASSRATNSQMSNSQFYDVEMGDSQSYSVHYNNLQHQKVQPNDSEIQGVHYDNSQHQKVQPNDSETQGVHFDDSQLQDAHPLDSGLEETVSGIEGVLCYMETEREPKLGSYVRIQGKFKEFAQATNPGEFDAGSYYEILGMQIRLQKGVLLKESGSYSKFREKLWEVKKYFAAVLEICFEEDSHIMKAMLLGEKSALDEDTKLLYQFNGIIHILSISGLHISMIGMGLYKLLKKLRCPKITTVIISLVFMYSYGIMTGMSISALRAIVMFGFHIAADVFGRTYDMLTAMAAVGIYVLLKQPYYLYHSGFLFSFGAILAIALFLPVLEENLFGNTKLEKLMLTSLSVSIITFPVYLCFYYEYPLYSVFLNLIIIPGTTLIMADALMGIALAAFYLPLGKYAVMPARIIFRFYELCCNFTLHLPESRSILGKPKSWQLAAYIMIILILVLCSKKLCKLQVWQWIIAALMCITLRFSDGLNITLIDVGQGDSIYIADENRCYLIDGGSSSKKDVGTYQILPFLKEEGCRKLDAVFITHMDSDHYNGICALIEDMAQGGIKIKNLIMPDIAEKSRSEAYHELVMQAQKEGIRVLYIHQGGSIHQGKLKLTCMHPEAGEGDEDTNEASTVLYLEYGPFSALFTGDLEGEGEKALIRRLSEQYREADGESDRESDGESNRESDRESNGESDKETAGETAIERHTFYDNSDDAANSTKNGITLLKVAHHGSRNSTSQAFLELLSPQIALISAGKDNSYGHPHKETIERLEKLGSLIYRTDEGGALTVTYKDGRVGIKCFNDK